MTTESKKRWMEKQRKKGLCIRCNKKARKGRITCKKHGTGSSKKIKYKIQDGGKLNEKKRNNKL